MRLLSFCLWLLALCGTPVDPAEAYQLDDRGFGPCDVTVTPEEPCERGEDDIKCPYLFNVPPLTIHLPKQLRELERMVEELQTLKDNVDELRRMCADCTVRPTGRECERESDSESERMSRNEEGRNWLNADSLKVFNPQHGTKMVIAGDRSEGFTEIDADNIYDKKEEEKNDKGAERRSTAGLINEEKNQDGKQVVDTNGAFPAQREGQDRWATNPGGKKREGGTNDRDNDRNGKENSRADRKDLLQGEEESVITSNLKKQEKTDDNDPHVSQDGTKETNIKTQSKENRSSYVENVSDEHINKRQEQQVEEEKNLMEEGIKVERGHEKLNQAEGKERGKSSRKGEVEEEKKETGTGQESKTKEKQTVQSAQADGDGGVASSKDTAKTQFASKGQTPSTSPGVPRQEPADSDSALSYRSSHGPPAFPSLTSPFPWIHKDLTTTSEGTEVQTTDLSASFITVPGPRKTDGPTTAPVKARSTPATPAANFSGLVEPTKVVNVAAFNHNSTARKNISSNANTGMKPLPGSKNPKFKKDEVINSHNPGPLADKKPKHDQKPRPFRHKPVAKPRHKEPRLVQGLKADQRTGDLPTDLNLKNIQTPKNMRGNTANQNLTNIQNSNSPQKPFLSAQRPISQQRNQPVNVNNPDRHQQTKQRSESTDIPNTTQNHKILHGGKKRIHSLKTHTTPQKSANGEKPKPNQNASEASGDFSENAQTTNVAPQLFQNPGTELLENADANPLAGPKDVSSAQQVTASLNPTKLPSQGQNTSLTPELEPGTTSNPTHREAETEPRPNLQHAHTEEGPETPQHHQTPRRSSKLVSEQKPEAESGNVPLSTPRSHTRPAEMPGATSAERSNTSVALKPNLKTETALDPLKMSRPTSDTLKTSQTNTKSPPGSAKPFTGVNICPTQTEVSSVRVKTQDSKTYSSLEDGTAPHLHTSPKHFPVSPNSRIITALKPQTSTPTPSTQATTTRDRVTSRILPSVSHESGPESFYSKPEPHLEPARPDQSPPGSLPDPPRESGEASTLDLNSNSEHTPADSSEGEPEPDGGFVSATQQPGSEDRHTLEQLPPRPVQTPLTQIEEKKKETSANSEAGSKPVLPDQKLDSKMESLPIKPKPGPAQKPGLDQSDSDFTAEPEAEHHPEPDKTSHVNQDLLDLTPDPILKPGSDGALGAGYDETLSPTLRSPSTPTAKPGAPSAQKSTPLFPIKSGSKPKPELHPPRVPLDPLQNSQMNFPPSPGPVKLPNDVTKSLGGAELSTMKMTTLDPKSSSSQDGQNLPLLHTLPGGFAANPNSRNVFRQRSQTTAGPSSVQMTKSPNGIILWSVPPSNSPTQPKQASNVDSKLHHNMEETTKSQIYDSNKMINLVSSSSSPDLRSASPARSGPEPPAPDAPTDRARELRVKINQVAAFFNNSRSASGRHAGGHSTERSQDARGGSRPDGIDSGLLTRTPSKGKACF